MSTRDYQTISAFCIETRHDRRTVQRELRARGIQPSYFRGTAAYYPLADLKSAVELEAGEGGEATGIDPTDLKLLAAFMFMSNALAPAVEKAFEEARLPASKAKTTTREIWCYLARRVLNSVDSDTRDQAVEWLSKKMGVDLRGL